MGNRLRRPRRARFAVLIGMAALLAVLTGRLLPAVAGTADPRWKHGVVNVYAAERGMQDTLLVAADRWSHSGARVRIRIVVHQRDADVVVRRDDKRLLDLCGKDCLGYTTSIGRPADGHSEILLRSNLGGEPRPLSVWVAAHEFGHVLGLHHRKGHDCSVMSPRAFDTSCAPSLASNWPTKADLACVPAPADVDVAAAMYGGAGGTRDPRCQ